MIPMILPAAIGALVIGMTLIYASFLDLRDRRVPHKTWHPALIVALPLAAWVYATQILHLNTQQVPGYLALLIGLPLLATAAEILWQKKQSRPDMERAEIYETLALMCVFSLPAATLIYGALVLHQVPATGYALLGCILCGAFYAFQRLNLFGGADAYALMIITACLPLYPWLPLGGTPPPGFFPFTTLPFTTLVNAVILNIAAPLWIFLRNLTRGDYAPFPVMFLGFPVAGDGIADTFGFVMEDIKDSDGALTRRFIGFREGLHRMIHRENHIYTKDLREHPDKFRDELQLYRRAGRVWISYAIPFIIPITAGFMTALVVGNIPYMILRIVTGA